MKQLSIFDYNFTLYLFTGQFGIHTVGQMKNEHKRSEM